MSGFSNIRMSIYIFALLYIDVVRCSADEEPSSSLGRGFGDHIDWRTFDDGLAEAKSSGKPLMLIIHKSWCGACKALKPKFSQSSDIESLSKHFVMVNTEDDEEPQRSEFNADGTYIPRIFFLDSNGLVQKEIYNENGNPSYKYYYFNADSIVDSMKQALKSLGGKETENKIEL